MASPTHGFVPTCHTMAVACDAPPSPLERPAGTSPRQLSETQPLDSARVDVHDSAGDGPMPAAPCSNAEPDAGSGPPEGSGALPSAVPDPQTPTSTTLRGLQPTATAPEAVPGCSAAPIGHGTQLQPSTSHQASQPYPADANDPASSSPPPKPRPGSLLPEDGGLLGAQPPGRISSSSPSTRSSPVGSPLSELDTDVAGYPVEYDYDGPPGHRLLRFKPTLSQWADFPALLSIARCLHAEQDGCFKVLLPDQLRDPLPEKAPQKAPANAYRVRQIRQRMFWQVSTIRTDGVFSSSEPETDFSDSADVAIKNLKTLFNKNKEKQMRNVRYRVDVPAWTVKQRREAGVPEQSPIHPLKGDKLEHTKAIIPGIHTPYVYESGPHFGATFQFHAEDFRLASLNHLYKGRKIWIVIPCTAVDIAEKALNRKGRCSQFMRHRAEFFFPERLAKMGIPYRIVDQRPGETIVVLPDAYHEGFSAGYTIAEAKNYADPDWTGETYQPCQVSCQLATAIPAEFMRPLREGEQRLDLCAGYGDGTAALQQQPQQDQQKQDQQSSRKRGHEQEADELLADRNAKQLKVR